MLGTHIAAMYRALDQHRDSDLMPQQHQKTALLDVIIGYSNSLCDHKYGRIVVPLSVVLVTHGKYPPSCAPTNEHALTPGGGRWGGQNMSPLGRGRITLTEGGIWQQQVLGQSGHMTCQ
jgi:hypothetical protein